MRSASSRFAAGAIVSLVALGATLGPVAGEAGTARAAVSSDSPKRSKTPAPSAELVATGEPRSDVALTVDPGGTAVRVSVDAQTPSNAATLALAVYSPGDPGARDGAAETVHVPALGSGDRVARTMQLDTPIVGDTGLAVTMTDPNGEVGRQFLAVRPTADGTLVSAPSMAALDDAESAAALQAGDLTAEQYASEVADAHTVAGSEGSTVTPAAAAAGNATVTGRVRYTYTDGSLHAARGALVRLETQVGVVAAAGRVNDDGSYALTGPVSDIDGEYFVRVYSDVSSARVWSGSSTDTFFANTVARRLRPGDLWAGADLELGGTSETAKAFAIADAARTVGDYYQSKRRADWDSRLTIRYPSGTDGSFARSSEHVIYIGGGETRCGSNWCPEDAFDWDVVAHESGHIVAYNAGMDASPGGDHNICDDAWTYRNEDGDLVSRTKADAIKLAWSEGWATFWGTTALKDQGVPAGFPPAVGDITYDDDPGPPYNAGAGFDYSLESDGMCGAPYSGETSELAVQLALWDLDDGSIDGESVNLTTADIYTRLWDGQPKTFDAAWSLLMSGRTATDVETAQAVLQRNNISPYNIRTQEIDAGCPLRFLWSAPHATSTYTIRFRTTGGKLLGSYDAATSAYTPTFDNWNSWARSYGKVVVDVSSKESTQVVTGPYRSSPKTFTVPVTPNSNTSACWTHQTWSNAFSATSARELPADQIDFAGHPLDVTFDSSGRVWGIGEFGMQVVRATAAGTDITKHNYPIKFYLTPDNQLLDWTKPFSSAFFPHASSSDLGESIVRAGSSVWTAQGGEQRWDATSNHSILTRFDSTAPDNTCAVPLPGDNNEVIGLAYDSGRGRLWFVESEGDHRQGSGYATIGWVKAAGIGSRCQNFLEYGGDPRLSDSQNASLRSSAQATINSLQCTSVQESDVNANCVHIVGGTALPSGAAHIAFDPAADALWITNWFDGKLRKYSIGTGGFQTFTPPPSSASIPVAWQIAANGTYVYFNEYMGNRILRFNKSTQVWSTIRLPFGLERQVHSIDLSGNELWFTVSDEDYDSATQIGYIDLSSWQGSVKGTLYTGWSSLPMHPNQKPGNQHSFRGLEVSGNRIAVSDHGDMAIVTLTRK